MLHKYFPMAAMSAGILIFRFSGKSLHVLLAHPGGPFWAKKEWNSWSIPKGEFDENENALEAALRETREETGLILAGTFVELEPVFTKARKKIFTWAIEADPDLSCFKSNYFEMEWPPKSGKRKSFPEVDKIKWFDLPEAEKRILGSQLLLLEQLKILLSPRLF